MARLARCQAGFSLIELLVVMVIIAVVATGVSLAINPTGSSAKRINQQGDRLYAQMQFALDDALIRHSALGIVLVQDAEALETTNQYSWRRYDGENWIKTEQPLGDHGLPQELTWSFELEGESLEASLDRLLADEDKARPVIVFYPSGDVTDFSVVITLSEAALADDPEALNERYKIALSERGELTYYPVGIEEE